MDVMEMEQAKANGDVGSSSSSSDQIPLTGGGIQKPNYLAKIVNGLTFVLVIVSVSLSAVTMNSVHNISSDSTCDATFATITTAPAVAPMCDGTCPQAQSIDNILFPKYYLYKYLLGPMKLVQSDNTGEQTLYSANMGAVNELQPLLCNYTVATGNTTATVFQYDASTQVFTRVITTVPSATAGSGGYAICMTLDSSSASYASLMQGQSYYGSATLFGITYDTIYAPIFDFDTGALIGCLYIGSPVISSPIPAEITSTYGATIDAAETGGASGAFTYSTNADNQGIYSWSIDFPSDFVFSDDAASGGCTFANVATQGLKYHFHTAWDNSTAYSSNVCGTATTGTQNHYDPYLACSSASQAISTLCEDVNRTASFGYVYGCNPSDYSTGSYTLCEVGDISGKFGNMMGVNTSSGGLSFTGSVTDMNPPPVQYYSPYLDEVSITPWASMVFHCVGSTSAPRAFCAKMTPYFLL